MPYILTEDKLTNKTNGGYDMDTMQVIGIFILSVIITFVLPQKAKAHCDTMDGPTVADGRKALETNNINYALKWIMPEYEEELSKIFKLCVKVRALGPEARELADQYFLESLVRIHRMGEGVPYTGVKPSGTPIDEKIAAADKSIAMGNLIPLEGMIAEERLPELEERFARAMRLKEFDVNDVAAGRKYIAAYVGFFKFAEGEEHEHEHGHGHAAEHQKA
jgi:hypothetical protein